MGEIVDLAGDRGRDGADRPAAEPDADQTRLRGARAAVVGDGAGAPGEGASTSVVLDLSDPAAAELALSGGKGASLARTAGALPVPPGFVVTADAYRELLAPLDPQLEELLAGGSGADLDATARAAADLVRSVPLPERWRAEVEEALARTGIDDRAVAVRSSGTMEDLPGAAFAGQHDTFLGVRGTDAVLAAVQDCFASLWNAHAVRYRDRLGVDHRDAAMAVVVQLLVDVSQEEAAGVAFSIDPVRGRLDEVLVNAAFGLGETVVAGEEPVDEFRVRRSDLFLVDETVETKARAIVSDPDGGTVTVALPAGQAATPALTETQRADVARLAVAAEEHAGFPQDIEWAFSGGELYLLQSRPVTRVAARWTRDESAERFPTPVTPLTWDLVEAGFHDSLNHSFALMGLPAFHDKWFAVRDSYVYGNQTAVDLYAGRLPTDMLRDVESLTAALPAIARDFRWVQELPHRWARDLDTYLLGIGALAATDLDRLDEPALWAHVKEISALGTAYFLPNIAISLTQRTLYGALLQMLRIGLPETQATAVFDTLLASTDTKTGQVNEELWQLSRTIRRDRALHEALAAHPGEAGLRVLEEHPAFAAAFRTFLDRHGHRELDFDAYHPTWVEAPHIVLDQVRLMAERSDEDDLVAADLRRKVDQAGAERAVVDAAPESLKYLVQEVIRLARTYTALDDLEHYQTTRLTLPLRGAARALGERLADRGVLGEPMDVFFLHVDQLDAVLGMGPAGMTSPRAAGEADRPESRRAAADPEAWERLAGLARAQKAAYLEAVARTPDWEHGVHAEATGDGEGTVTGTAGSPGSVEGEVFVVHGPEDFSSFPDGAILVARTTNPAWTALFYRASGVITESGGALSHGAVTARELGLPAVMAVRGATSLFTDGERVRVNGAEGTVLRLA